MVEVYRRMMRRAEAEAAVSWREPTPKHVLFTEEKSEIT